MHIQLRQPSWTCVFFLLGIALVFCLSGGTTLSVSTDIPLDSAGQSLKDAARANGGKAHRRVFANMPFASLSLVTETADLIVHGTVLRTEARLTNNDEYVRTYVTLVPLEFLKGHGDTNTSARPGPIAGIVFAESGGTAKVDGLEITVPYNMAAKPPIQVGEQVIAFLVKNDDAAAFILNYGAYGLLRVRGDRVEPASERAANRPSEPNTFADVRRLILQARVARH